MYEEKTIWGIHMDLRHEMSAVTDGYVAIDWGAVGDLTKIPSTRDAYKRAVEAAYPATKSGAIPVHAGTLYKFALEMKVGDLVVYPSKPDRQVNLGVIEGDYFYATAPNTWCPNRRRVRWLRHVPRPEFSQSALYEIGSAVTLFQVKNNAPEFLAAFDGQTSGISDLDEETVEIASTSAEENTRDFIIKRLKTGIDPYQFEKFVAHLLERMGYHARVTQKSNDGGVDILASKDELGFEAPIIKVQCKQTLNSIGQPEVAQLYGHIEPREHGLFVTLGEYSNQARQFERGKHNLRLISGNDLTDLIFNHYDAFEPRYQILLPLKRIYSPSAVSKDSFTD